jgi:hypothetical protein
MSSSPASRYRTVALDDGEIFYREAGDSDEIAELIADFLPRVDARGSTLGQ